ncbi:hypothetical protein THAOC_30746 [Thalassiosira oceanica]|uniref:Uncharacterized protein n=1 Tax=Thalassiosira oceanica TaxID=159749 RepID=K0RN35_THAOC|nr:hypothetical protein THAOC_30746 [Thalassiosira oceanica]|eukprot:EJK50306.1 hypothetical protein THAOC_30746 [Thalassiosira oceanica]
MICRLSTVLCRSETNSNLGKVRARSAYQVVRSKAPAWGSWNGPRKGPRSPVKRENLTAASVRECPSSTKRDQRPAAPWRTSIVSWAELWRGSSELASPPSHDPLVLRRQSEPGGRAAQSAGGKTTTGGTDTQLTDDHTVSLPYSIDFNNDTLMRALYLYTDIGAEAHEPSSSRHWKHTEGEA